MLCFTDCPILFWFHLGTFFVLEGSLIESGLFVAYSLLFVVAPLLYLSPLIVYCGRSVHIAYWVCLQILVCGSVLFQGVCSRQLFWCHPFRMLALGKGPERKLVSCRSRVRVVHFRLFLRYSIHICVHSCLPWQWLHDWDMLACILWLPSLHLRRILPSLDRFLSLLVHRLLCKFYLVLFLQYMVFNTLIIVLNKLIFWK